MTIMVNPETPHLLQKTTVIGVLRLPLNPTPMLEIGVQAGSEIRGETRAVIREDKNHNSL